MIEYSVEKPTEPEFIQHTGQWFHRTWRLSLFQSVVVLTGHDVQLETNQNLTLISYWDTNDYHTMRVTLPKTWEWA